MTDYDELTDRQREAVDCLTRLYASGTGPFDDFDEARKFVPSTADVFGLEAAYESYCRELEEHGGTPFVLQPYN